MYPGTSLLQYPKMTYDKNTVDLIEKPHTGVDESLKKSNDKSNDLFNKLNGELITNERDHDTEVLESPKIIKKLHVQIKNTENYWKRQFSSRHSIGILAKEWLGR